MTDYATVVIRPLRCSTCNTVRPSVTFVAVHWVDIGPGGDQHNEQTTLVHNRDECINVVLEWARRETWDGKLRAITYE